MTLTQQRMYLEAAEDDGDVEMVKGQPCRKFATRAEAEAFMRKMKSQV